MEILKYRVNANSEWQEIAALVGPQGPAGNDGAPGKDGYTPVKGVDYYTEAEKQELINEVLAALPAAEGVSF